MFACHADGRSKPFLHSSCRYVCAKMTRVKLRMNPPIQKPITVNCQLRQCLFEIPVRNLMQLDRKLDRHDKALPGFIRPGPLSWIEMITSSAVVSQENTICCSASEGFDPFERFSISCACSTASAAFRTRL